jgi:hypothetical protein
MYGDHYRPQRRAKPGATDLDQAAEDSLRGAEWNSRQRTEFERWLSKQRDSENYAGDAIDANLVNEDDL